MQKSKGIVSIALGSEHLDLAYKSIESIYNTGSFPPIAIITDSTIERIVSIVNNQIKIIPVQPICADFGISSAYLKTQLHKLSPFDKTLYLDTDIRAVQNIDCVWSWVDEGIGACRAFKPIDPNQFYKAGSEEEYTRSKLDPNDPFQFNTGMFLFVKSSAMQVMFNIWEREWSRFKHHENMAFTRMMTYYKDDVMPVIIPDVYNDFYPSAGMDSVLVHYISWYKKYL